MSNTNLFSAATSFTGSSYTRVKNGFHGIFDAYPVIFIGIKNCLVSNLILLGVMYCLVASFVGLGEQSCTTLFLDTKVIQR